MSLIESTVIKLQSLTSIWLFILTLSMTSRSISKLLLFITVSCVNIRIVIIKKSLIVSIESVLIVNVFVFKNPLLIFKILNIKVVLLFISLPFLELFILKLLLSLLLWLPLFELNLLLFLFCIRAFILLLGTFWLFNSFIFVWLYLLSSLVTFNLLNLLIFWFVIMFLFIIFYL